MQENLFTYEKEASDNGNVVQQKYAVNTKDRTCESWGSFMKTGNKGYLYLETKRDNWNF